MVGKFPSRARRELVSAFIVLINGGILVALTYSLLIASRGNNLASYVYAKCPGIPYGSTSGGPDYIDIAIDAALVAVFCVFLYLTIRDMRRKAKEKTKT